MRAKLLGYGLSGQTLLCLACAREGSERQEMMGNYFDLDCENCTMAETGVMRNAEVGCSSAGSSCGRVRA